MTRIHYDNQAFVQSKFRTSIPRHRLSHLIPKTLHGCNAAARKRRKCRSRQRDMGSIHCLVDGPICATTGRLNNKTISSAHLDRILAADIDAPPVRTDPKVSTTLAVSSTLQSVWPERTTLREDRSSHWNAELDVANGTLSSVVLASTAATLPQCKLA
jgi:hypothetical protein